jgi:uncharacterized membrane protein
MNNKIYTVFYKHKKNIIGLLFLALTAFYCTIPLFAHYGIPSGQDIILHIFQADQFDRAIHEGVLYPRWISDFNNGYGSANFIFYSPLSYYLVSAIKIFTPSLTIAMIIAIWCSFFLSGITMSIAINRMYGKSGSILSAIIYQILPYHLFDLYVRGTFAELFALVWFPLIILFLHKMLESRNKTAAIGLSVSYAGLILTHLASGFIFSFVIGAYLFYHYFSLKNKKILIKSFLSLALGLGLSSVYLIPVIFERKFVQIEYIVTCRFGDYKRNFLFMLDKFQKELQSFYLPLHTIVILEVILFLFTVMLIRKNRQVLLNRPLQNFFIFLFLFAFFLTTPLSRPVWNIIPGFPFLQFPWRWVLMMELSLCFLIGPIFKCKDMPTIRSKKFKKVIMYILIVLSSASFALILNSKIILNKLIEKITKPEEVINYVIPFEYTPIWVKDIEKISSDTKHERVSVISGEALTTVAEWKSEKRVIKVEASNPALLRIATFYYPGWIAEIDGHRIPIKIEKDSGAMLINIPKGEHSLILQFKDTSIRYYARLISLASVFIITVFLLASKKPGT